MWLLLCAGTAGARAEGLLPETPPIQPKIQPVPLPPPVVLPPPPSVPEDVPNRPITASEAARIALRHQETVAIAEAGITAARGRTRQARSGLRPTLQTSAGFTNLVQVNQAHGAAARTTPTTGTTPGSTGTGTGTSAGTGTGASALTGTGTGSSNRISEFQISASLRQLLTDLGHTRSLVRQAEAEERVARATLSRTHEDLVFQVKQAFYTLLQDVRLVGVSEVQVRDQQAHLALARARLDAGVGLPSDVVRAETAVAEAVLNLTTARANAALARVNLATTMGLDPRTPILAADSAEPPADVHDVGALVARALARRPEVLGAQQTVRALEYAVNAAKTTNAPAISASVGLAATGVSFPPLGIVRTLGVQVQWTPFNGGLTAGLVQEAQANLLIAAEQLHTAERTVTNDVAQAYVNLVTARQRLAAAEAEVANAEEGVRLATGRYEAGVGIFLDVVDAQSALQTALVNRVNARAAVELATAALEHAVGAPVP